MLVTLILSIFFYSINSGVVELTDSNFNSRINGKNSFIMFYSPNCGHCMRMKPTYESLGSKKSIIDSGVVIAKVDCTDAGRKTCQQFSVSGFPTVKFISRVDDRNDVTEYNGNRELDNLERFVLDHTRSAIVEVSESHVKAFIESRTLPVIFGFFKDSNSKFYSKLVAISSEQRANFIFGYTFSEKVAKELGQKPDTVVLFRQVHYKSPLEEHSAVCSSEKDLSSFLSKNKHSIVEYRDKENSESFKLPMITAFIPIDPNLQRSDAKRIRNVMIKHAVKHTDIVFTVSKKSDFESFMKDIAPDVKPKEIYIVAMDKDEKKFVSKGVAKIDDPKGLDSILEKFVSDFKDGSLERFVKSQPVDTPDDGYVKVAVASNFDEIVINNDKDVLVEFYAPWCGHCKKLAPIYQQMATLLKDEPNLVIAKYDLTTNDQQKNFEVQGFPTIFLAVAGKKNKPVQFDGKRDAKSMIEWLRKKTKHGIQFDGEIPEIKEEL